MPSQIYNWEKIVKTKGRKTLRRGKDFGFDPRPNVPIHVFSAQCYAAVKRLGLPPITIHVLDQHTLTIEPRPIPADPLPNPVPAQKRPRKKSA